MSNHYLIAWGTHLPFSHKNVVLIMHEQNTIILVCSKIIFCQQVFALHVMVFSQCKERKNTLISKDNNDCYQNNCDWWILLVLCIGGLLQLLSISQNINFEVH